MSFSHSADVDALAAALPRLDAGQRDDRAKRSLRATFIKWLRKVHGWVGLWGAALGLLFGATGFVLNHRGEPLHISQGAPRVSSVQLAVPNPAYWRIVHSWPRYIVGCTPRVYGKSPGGVASPFASSGAYAPLISMSASVANRVLRSLLTPRV